MKRDKHQSFFIGKACSLARFVPTEEGRKGRYSAGAERCAASTRFSRFEWDRSVGIGWNRLESVGNGWGERERERNGPKMSASANGSRLDERRELAGEQRSLYAARIPSSQVQG